MLILPKLPNNFRPVLQEKKVGNWVKVKKGQLVPVIDKLVFTAAERVLHGPVKSQFGFHLVEVKFRM